jgi:hypothetical protein
LLESIVREGPCAFEFFHQAPTLDEVLHSLRKILLLRPAARLAAGPDEPWLWIIAAGRPQQLLGPFGFEPDTGWPQGVYSAPRALRVRLVIVSELPEHPDTLLLRVLGAGATLRRAIRELRLLDPKEPVGRSALRRLRDARTLVGARRVCVQHGRGSELNPAKTASVTTPG